MEIKISKQDDNILISYDEVNEILNFDSLKKLSKLFLDKKIKNEDVGYSVNIDGNTSLDIYKNTVEEVLDSVIDDTELVDLFKESEKKQWELKWKIRI